MTTFYIILSLRLLPVSIYYLLLWTVLMRQLPELKKAKLELELEGDFGDLYLNCNELLLLSCVKIDTKLAKFSDPSFLSIKNSYQLFHATLLFSWTHRDIPYPKRFLNGRFFCCPWERIYSSCARIWDWEKTILLKTPVNRFPLLTIKRWSKCSPVRG